MRGKSRAEEKRVEKGGMEEKVREGEQEKRQRSEGRGEEYGRVKN